MRFLHVLRSTLVRPWSWSDAAPRPQDAGPQHGRPEIEVIVRFRRHDDVIREGRMILSTDHVGICMGYPGQDVEDLIEAYSPARVIPERDRNRYDITLDVSRRNR